jgi:small subunit ribosomal protein S4e
MSRHLKRLNAPKAWLIQRRTTKYIAKPLPGAHRLGESLAIALILKQLGHAKTTAEAKKILNASQVLIDGCRVRDPKAPAGILDSISLPQTDEHYRIILDTKGRLQLARITKQEAGSKLCKVINKTMQRNNKLQYNLNDGRNLLLDAGKAKTGDTLLISVPEQKVQQCLALEKGTLIYLFGGKHTGTFGTVQRTEGNKIIFTANGQEISTAKRYAIAVGKDKPVLTLARKE